MLQAQARRIDETRMRLSDQERRDRAQQLQRTKLLLVHAATCQKKIAGGCPLCRCVGFVMVAAVAGVPSPPLHGQQVHQCCSSQL